VGRLRGDKKRMCPACLAALAMIVAGATSTGGLALAVAKKVRNDTSAKLNVAMDNVKREQAEEKRHEQDS
jgi:hypothetical protein